jgi:hypothetical protein
LFSAIHPYCPRHQASGPAPARLGNLVLCDGNKGELEPAERCGERIGGVGQEKEAWEKKMRERNRPVGMDNCRS